MPGASGGQFVLDTEAQVFFSVNAKNQLVWSPVAGVSMPIGFYPDQCVSDLLEIRRGRFPVHNPGHDISMLRLVYLAASLFLTVISL
jgi:hypothetical protein